MRTTDRFSPAHGFRREVIREELSFIRWPTTICISLRMPSARLSGKWIFLQWPYQPTAFAYQSGLSIAYRCYNNRNTIKAEKTTGFRSLFCFYMPCSGVYTIPFPWQFLYFLPLPQGHGSLRPTFGSALIGSTTWRWPCGERAAWRCASCPGYSSLWAVYLL